MASPYNLPDYVTKHFEYKQINKIHDKLTVESILLLFFQIKRNEQTASTALGGGQLGSLAFVIAPIIYTSILGTAVFIILTHPSVIAVTQATLYPPKRANPIPDHT